MLILIWGEIGIGKIPHLSLRAIFSFPTYGLELVVKNRLVVGFFIFTTPAKPWRGEWEYYLSWLMGILFPSIASHGEKSNPYFSSDEDYLKRQYIAYVLSTRYVLQYSALDKEVANWAIFKV